MISMSPEAVAKVLRGRGIDLAKIASDQRLREIAVRMAYSTIPIPWRWVIGPKRVARVIDAVAARAGQIANLPEWPRVTQEGGTAMERTESIVVQVAPYYENAKIKEMEAFGWNLQNRQEIHEEGDAYGRPSYIDRSEYIIKTTVYHYVKLHFVRSLGLPNIELVKALETQYFGLPFPRFPRLAPPGGLIGLVLLMFWYPFWPLWYYFGYKPKKAAADAQLAETVRKQQEILSEVAALL